MLIYLKNGAKEQLNKTGINPWHQEIEFKKELTKDFEEELLIEAHEVLYLISGNLFTPAYAENEKELNELMTRIKTIKI